MHILHLITGLGTGGAEMMLYKLLSHMDSDAYQNEVLSLTDCGAVGQRIQALDIPVSALGMTPGVPSPRSILEIARRIRRMKPDVIQTWMYHADLLGAVAARLAGGTPVVWNIRHAGMEPRLIKRSTLWTAKMCMRLARRLPSRIVCCSEAAAHTHVAFGYPAQKMVVIRNGFALDAYQPNPDARSQVRRELGIAPDAPLIGLIARFDPAKDHANFLRAAGHLHSARPDAHFLLCGKEVTTDNPALASEIAQAGIGKNCHLLGLRQDMPRLTAALDIAASSSAGEGFPNAIGEAMACAVPCVVTDVGDSAMLVGDTGRVVPPRNFTALSDAWQEVLALPSADRQTLGERARRRVETHFDIRAVASCYEQLYEEVAAACVD